MFEYNAEHIEEYENYIEDQGEDIRDTVMHLLSTSLDQWRMDGSKLKMAGAFSSVDVPVDIAALKLSLEAPARKITISLEAVGFTDPATVQTHTAITATVWREGTLPHEAKDYGRTAVDRTPSTTVYETLNDKVAAFLVDALFDMLQ